MRHIALVVVESTPAGTSFLLTRTAWNKVVELASKRQITSEQLSALMPAVVTIRSTEEQGT